jgi:acyl-CoA thioesterase-2
MDNNLFNTEEVLSLLKLQPIAPDRYLGQSHFMGSPNVFGGQVASQALSAAIATVEHRRPHSLHAMFILPGNHRLPIEYEVERVRDGGSFSVRRVVAIQEGKRIFVAMVSFQQSEEGLSHQKEMRAQNDPETLPSVLEHRNQHATLLSLAFHPVPVDFRIEPDTADNTVKRVWIKSPMPLSDDVAQHETLFAYVSDYGLLPTSLQPHKDVVRMGEGRLQMASLDHTIWFHRPFRMDEWLLFSMETPNASGGRGLSFAHVYNREGVLVASLAQEGLIRMREPRPQ